MKEMKQYTINMISAQHDWSAIPQLAIDCKYSNTTDDVRAFGQICCNESELLIHLWTEQKEIRAEEQGLLGMPCKDSCLEFFFCPQEEDIRYLNIEFNFNKCLFLGIGTGLQDLSRIIVSNIESIFSPKVYRTEHGWEIYFKVPYQFIRRFFPNFQVFDGKTIRANCYTCSESSAIPYDFSWNRIQGTPLTFHRPEDFGIMDFRLSPNTSI